MVARALHSFCTPPPMHTAHHQRTCRRHSTCAGTRRGTAVGPPPRQNRSPELHWHSRWRLTQDRRNKASPVRCFDNTSVSPFVVICRRHHPATSTSLDCQPRTSLRHRAGSRPHDGELLLRPHSHAAAFEALGEPSRAPDTTPAATALPALVIVSVVWITLLAGVAGGTSVVCAVLPNRHRLQQTIHRESAADFRGPNVEASPYPSTKVIRDLAPSSTRLTGKPSRAFRG